MRLPRMQLHEPLVLMETRKGLSNHPFPSRQPASPIQIIMQRLGDGEADRLLRFDALHFQFVTALRFSVFSNAP